MKNLRVSVVGAGIAGLTLAASLSSKGVHCEVFEQARHLREVGAGIQLAPNATRILVRLGLCDFLRTVAVPVNAIEMRGWDDDRLIARTTLGSECQDLYGAPYYTAHRADVHRGLLELLPHGTVHLGRTCTQVIEGSDEVTLLFGDGSRSTVDVVVGADGIHSTIRDHLIHDQPQYSGQSIYRGLVRADRLTVPLGDPTVTLWLGPGRHGVCYPVSGGELISFGATVPATEAPAESWSAQGSVAELAAEYAGWAERFSAVISAAETVNRWALHDRRPVARWNTDRVTVIGDAAHPMLPFMAQGANQAIEDAAALAVLLRTATHDDVATALDQYTTLRATRTADVQRGSRANSEILHLPDGASRQDRDVELIGRANLRNQEWLFGYDVEKVAASS